MWSSDPLFLGAEPSSARAGEARHPGEPSPLVGVAYAPPAGVLWRWADAAEDAAVAAFVESYVGAADRGRIRASLTMDDFYTLITFSRRSVLAALRTRVAGHVAAGFGALSAIELARVDWRDVSWAAALVTYAGQRLGLATAVLARYAASRAEPPVAEILNRTGAGAAVRLKSWGYREVETGDGPVLLDHDRGRVDPELVERALQFAAALDADGYEVGGVSAGDRLADVWLAPPGVEALAYVRACAGVSARLAGADEQMLLGYLLRTTDPASARTLAVAAEGGGVAKAATVAMAQGDRCAIVIARSWVAEVPAHETRTSLTRFRALLADLLADDGEP